MRDQCLSNAIIVWFLLTTFFIAGAQSLDNTSKGAGYWAPTNPPRAYYTIECQIYPSSDLLSGAETIRFVNTTSKPIHRLALDWIVNKAQTIETTIHEKPVPILADSSYTELPSPLLFELPEALLPGEQVELEIGFKKTLSTREGKKMTVVKWHPRLWWGFRTHHDYDVRIETSPDYLVATTGLLRCGDGL
ncbi:M1 family metallopeptidase, partial [candidate division KSB1 bacterium]|nr:M1 family metallopeptidase [candidate division KSB1 bacterium]NIR72238.1 M1 family metallopeptidase [candidate division KSB1 bacterium]NIS26304.1 M1 family metallopeptidase [candidate division KSB1 bacterium]NIT73067.1 M1 family metallopeptidase [candidate division KSB1 bacterium]NIU26974.1 M1 family metallopeptidase [candidate division KSB1 bacterium]